MKGKVFFSKIIAIVCAITLVVGAINLPAIANASGNSEGGYRVIGTEHMAGVDANNVFAWETSWTAKRLTNIADDIITSLDGIMFDAVYNFADNAACGIGGHLGAGANRFQMGITTVSGVKVLRYQFVNGNVSADIPLADLGYTLGNDIRIKVGFRFADVKETANTADITAEVHIGNDYVNTITVNDYNTKDSFINTGGVVIGPSGKITLKPVPDEIDYKVINVNYIRNAANGMYVNTTGEKPERFSQVSDDVVKSLDGVMFDGIFNFGHEGFFCMGGQSSTGGRFQMQLVQKDNVYYLRYQLVGSSDTLTDVSMEQLGTDIVGKDTRMQIGFSFANVNTTNKTANVTVKIKIGNTYTHTLKANGHAIGSFSDNSGVICSIGKELTIKKVKADSEYKVIGSNYIAGADADGVFTNTTGAPGKRLTNVAEDKITSLNGVMFDALWNFSSGSAFGLGHHLGGGLNRLQIGATTRDGAQVLLCQFVNGNTFVAVPLTEINYTLGQDIRIRVGFTFDNVDETNKTADITAHIKIGDTYEAMLTVYTYSIANSFVDASGAIVGPSGAITLKPVPNQGGTTPTPDPEPEPGYKDESEYTVLDVSDFTGVNEFVVAEIEEPAKRPSSIEQAGTLDGIMIDGIFKFEGGALLNIGARQYGLQLNMVDKQGTKYLRYQLVGSGSYVDVSAAEASSSVYATDLHIKLGFTLSNVRTEAGTEIADVDVQVHIGDTYKNIYKVTGYPTARLNRYFIVDARGAGNKLTIKSANPAPEFKDESDFTVLDMSDFIGQEELVVTGREEPAKTPSSIAQAGTLDGIMIDGIYKFEGGTINIGARQNGLQLNLVTKENVQYLRYQLVGANKAVDVSATDANCDIAGEDVRIKVGFTFSNVNEQTGTADVAVQIHIGEVYKNIYTATNYSTAKLNRLFVVDARPDGGSNSLTLKTTNPAPVYKDDSEYTVVKVESFTRKATYEINGEEAGMRPDSVAQEGTLDGLLIDGVYNFSGTPTLNMGGRQKGLQFQIVEIEGEKYLRYQLVGSGKVREVSAQDIGTQIYEQDLHIKVGFTFTESTVLAGTYDVEMQVCVGDTYKDIYTVTGFGNVDVNLARILFADARTDGSTLIIKAIELQEEPEPEFKDESEYTLVAVQDFTGENVSKVDGTEVGMRPSDVATVGTLDGLLIDGIYNFQGNPTLNMGGRQNGLQFNFVEKAGEKYLRYQLVGSGIAEDVSAEDIGADIYGKDIRIKAGFTFTNVNEEAGTADVAVQIHIGDTYKDMYVIKNYEVNSRLQRIVFVDARGEGNVLTMKAVEKPEVPLPPLPKDSEYKKITFEDFGIITDVTVEGIEAGYRAGAGTLDGYMIEGKFNFNGGATVNFGGKFNGLQMNLIEKAGKTFLRYQLVGSGMSTDVAASKVGCDLSGTDLKVVVGFTFANVDETAGTADVTVQVRIGDSYKNAFVAEDYPVEKLQRIMFVDARGEGNKVILRRPDMEPIIFEEFGFTKNYEIELGLKKK